MIYDCFSFFNELDVLEIRLNVLDGVVDRFVIAESPWTHTGKPKAYLFEENKARFARFADKIIHIKIAETPTPPEGLTPDESRWFLENYQRNALARGLADAQPDDVVMVSDCDEIPDPESVRKLPGTNAITHFHPRNYSRFLNFRDYRTFFSGVGTTALKYRRFRDPATYAGFPFTGYVAKANNPTPTLTQVRYLSPTRRRYGGWHFSYMGGAEAIRLKLNSLADGDLNGSGSQSLSTEDIERHLRESGSIFGTYHPLFAEPPALHMPRYVIDNQDRYRSLLMPIDEAEFRRTRLHRLRIALGEFRKIFKDHYLIPYLASVKYALARFLHRSAAL